MEFALFDSKFLPHKVELIKSTLLVELSVLLNKCGIGKQMGIIQRNQGIKLL